MLVTRIAEQWRHLPPPLASFRQKQPVPNRREDRRSFRTAVRCLILRRYIGATTREAGASECPGTILRSLGDETAASRPKVGASSVQVTK